MNQHQKNIHLNQHLKPRKSGIRIAIYTVAYIQNHNKQTLLDFLNDQDLLIHHRPNNFTKLLQGYDFDDALKKKLVDQDGMFTSENFKIQEIVLYTRTKNFVNAYQMKKKKVEKIKRCLNQGCMYIAVLIDGSTTTA